MSKLTNDMKHLLAIALTGLAFLSQGANIPHEQAAKNAYQFATKLHNGKQIELSKVVLNGYKYIDIYNINCGGYVIVSTDDRTLPILAYAQKGDINPQSIPDGMKYWLSEYERQIEMLGNLTLDQLERTAQPKDSYPATVDPLITSQWTQSGLGYNSLVPTDDMLEYLGGHPTVGCMALAAAQVMRYWQFPEHGYGSNSYSHYDSDCWRYGTVSADFAATTYDYANMPDRLVATSSDEEVEAVATLLFHCGVACNMNYNIDCQGSSGAHLHTCRNGLIFNFHYHPDCTIHTLNGRDIAEWADMLKADLAGGKPILYCGESREDDALGTVSGAHAFVCDGYDEDNYFHFNWGWGGSGDGYFSLQVLRPNYLYDFAAFQYCLTNLHPTEGEFFAPILAMGGDLVVDTPEISIGDTLKGQYVITNLGDTALDVFVGINLYDNDNNYRGCIEAHRAHILPNELSHCNFSHPITELTEGNYMAVMQYSNDTFYAGIPYDATILLESEEYNYYATFTVSGTRPTAIDPVQRPAISIAPNPAQNHINLSGVDNGTILNIYNAQGQHLRTVNYQGQAIDVADLSAGTYIITTPEHTLKFNKIR